MARKIICLDLGSESMHAIFGDIDALTINHVNLQANAQKWENIENLDLLKENGKPSYRLRNRIALMNQRQDEFIYNNQPTGTLNFSHAKLDFNQEDNYKQSIFKFFEDALNPEQNYFCNPKIAFVRSAGNIIPKIQGKINPNQQINFSPDCLLKHLTSQILNNFIKYAPECTNCNFDDTELLLTVPNVYSLTHIRELMDFVGEHTSFNRSNIDFIYESDAIAYAAFAKDLLYDNRNINFSNTNFIDKIAKKVRDSKTPVYLITVDIGKGTSDLSFVRIEKNDSNDGNTITNYKVESRVGLTIAGARLDYIFASFLNKNLVDFGKAKSFQLPFNFLDKGGEGESKQLCHRLLQEAIFLIKKNINKHYFFKDSVIQEVPEVIHKSKLDSIRQTLIKNSYQQYADRVPEYYQIKVSANRKSLLNQFQNINYNVSDEILQRFMIIASIMSKLLSVSDQEKTNFKEELPEYLLRGLFNLLSNIPILKGFQYFTNLNLELCNEIKNYIKTISVDLIKVLRENIDFSVNGFGTDKDNTFLLIAGQGSHFSPLLEKLISSMRDGNRFNILKDQTSFVKGNGAKELCCIGAFNSKRGGFNFTNKEDILGTYGFKTPLLQKYATIDHSHLNNNGKVSLLYHLDNTRLSLVQSYVLFFSSQLFGKSNPPENIWNGFTACMGSHTFSNIPAEIEYDKQNSILKINGDIVRLTSYGSIDNNDEIYKSVWPELLRDSNN